MNNTTFAGLCADIERILKNPKPDSTPEQLEVLELALVLLWNTPQALIDKYKLLR